MLTNHHIAAALAHERQRDLLEASHRQAALATPVAAMPQLSADAEPSGDASTAQPVVHDGRIGLRIARGRAQDAHSRSSSRSRERARAGMP
jgi:hypothetical protein